MSQFNLQRPLDPDAIKRANDIFYFSHPEMVVQGQRQPIYPLEPQHEAYRDEWEYYYLNKGGQLKAEPLIDSSDKVSNTTGECQKTKDVIIVDLLYLPHEQIIYPLTLEDMQEIEAEEQNLNKLISPLRAAHENADSMDSDTLKKAKTKVQQALIDFGIDTLKNTITTSTSGRKGIIEGIRYRGRHYTYIRSDKIKTHRRSYAIKAKKDVKHFLDAQGKFRSEDLKELLARIRSKEFKKYAQKNLGDNSFKVNFEWKIPNEIIANNAFFQWANGYKSQRKSEWLIGDGSQYDTPNERFDARLESQLMRFVMGAGFSADFEPMKGKFHINARGSADFALAEAQAKAEGYLPGKEGIPLKFDMPLKNSKKTREIDLGGVCINYEFILYDYAGASVALGLKTHFDISNALMKMRVGTPEDHKKKSERTENKPVYQGMEGKAGFFAGIKAGCDVKGKLLWRNPEKNDDFSDLAETGYGASVSAGAALSGDFKISYDEKANKFLIRCKAELVFGVGASGEAEFTINGNNLLTLIQFVYQALRDRDFDYLKLIDKNAFRLLSLIMFRNLIMQESINYITSSLITTLEEWWKEIEHNEVEAKKLAVLIKENPKNNAIRFSTPEVKGKALAVLSETFYLSFEEEQEDAIIIILEWIQSKRDYHEVLEHIPLNSGPVPKYDAAEAEQRLLKILDLQQKGKFLKWRNDLPEEAISKGKVKKQALWNKIT